MNSEPNRLLDMLEAHGKQLFALFTRVTLRSGVAEDLLQELFLKLRNSAGFASAENQQAYLFRTAIHLAFDWRRIQRPTESLSQEQHTLEQAPLDRLIDAEALERILDAMQLLSELMRQCLVLRYLQSQAYAEIATQLGKTEHQIRGLCHKGLGELRVILRPAEQDLK